MLPSNPKSKIDRVLKKPTHYTYIAAKFFGGDIDRAMEYIDRRIIMGEMYESKHAEGYYGIVRYD